MSWDVWARGIVKTSLSCRSNRRGFGPRTRLYAPRFVIGARPVEFDANTSRAFANLRLVQRDCQRMERRPFAEREHSEFYHECFEQTRMRVARKKRRDTFAIPLIVDHRVRALLRRLAAIGKARVDHQGLRCFMLVRMNADARRDDEFVDEHAPAAPSARRRCKRRNGLDGFHDISGRAASSMIRQK